MLGNFVGWEDEPTRSPTRKGVGFEKIKHQSFEEGAMVVGNGCRSWFWRREGSYDWSRQTVLPGLPPGRVTGGGVGLSPVSRDFRRPNTGSTYRRVTGAGDGVRLGPSTLLALGRSETGKDFNHPFPLPIFLTPWNFNLQKFQFGSIGWL